MPNHKLVLNRSGICLPFIGQHGCSMPCAAPFDSGVGLLLSDMRKIVLSSLVMLAFACSSLAQASADNLPLSRLRGDYNQVGIVARVKVKNIKFDAPGPHPVYLLQGEVVESFKGNLRRGQALEFYMAVEDDFNVNSRLGDWIVFLEKGSHAPDKKPGWFVLENSSLPYSGKLVSKLRRIKNERAGMRGRRSPATH